MRKKVCRFILHLLGWKVEVSVPDYPKCVICVAPHTSNTDFFLGKLAYLSIGRHAGFLIKKDWFFFPLNIIFRSMGGIPVDRSKHSDLIDQIVDKFNKHEHFNIAITPEATRKRNTDWKCMDRRKSSGSDPVYDKYKDRGCGGDSGADSRSGGSGM